MAEKELFEEIRRPIDGRDRDRLLSGTFDVRRMK